MYTDIRPQYESQCDINNEVAVKKIIEQKFICNLKKLPTSYIVDYTITMSTDTIVGWAEIKCRKNTASKYPTYMISLKKMSEGIRLSELTETPFHIFVQFTDKLMRYTVSTADPIKYRVGGRSVQTRDSQDIEPCAYIPMNLFKEVVDANKH